jgi:hypothetical protein
MNAQILIAGVVIGAGMFVYGLAELEAIIVVLCIFYILGRPMWTKNGRSRSGDLP